MFAHEFWKASARKLEEKRSHFGRSVAHGFWKGEDTRSAGLTLRRVGSFHASPPARTTIFALNPLPCAKEGMCYISVMTKDQVKEVLDRVLTWPQKRQEDAARILSEMEEQDASPYHLTDEQVAEVKRRLADPKAGLRAGVRRHALFPRSLAIAEQHGGALSA